MGNIPADCPPPSPETVEAAMKLLSRVPETWAAVPELSHIEGQDRPGRRLCIHARRTLARALSSGF